MTAQRGLAMVLERRRSAAAAAAWAVAVTAVWLILVRSA